jgi:hypothetical protein
MGLGRDGSVVPWRVYARAHPPIGLMVQEEQMQIQDRRRTCDPP